MANEALIYRITRTVYDRLGSTVDEATVEQLVTDIYNQVQTSGNDLFGRSDESSAEPRASAEGSSDRLVISVFGLDHPGIVAGVSQILAEAGCSIIDINQTVGARVPPS
jgi:UTP:GlnB (protein PII) uridylyltransferase